ncbi:hypothetical protein MKX47_20415 [Solibacillus sp. FSL R7-0668]|uniref:hypothetical protein n=1 Tax=Solibacillus sp. FSL R7-0668 TaxID=2921688 RepID=UPI0030FCFDDD
MIINREVGAQGKGFRLQRLRAIKLLIDKILEGREVYVATEHLDDVYIKSVTMHEVEEVAESDKNYSSRDTFTFATKEVRNSIVSFFDTWVECGKRKESLYFCFYTNIGIGEERNVGIVKELGLKLPSKSLIRCLINKEYKFKEQINNEEVNINVLEITKAILVKEYTSQYEGKESKGNLKILETLDEDLYLNFLESIDWQFGQEDEKELEDTLIH